LRKVLRKYFFAEVAEGLQENLSCGAPVVLFFIDKRTYIRRWKKGGAFGRFAGSSHLPRHLFEGIGVAFLPPTCPG
jgi:hypothetical protein